MGRPCFIGWDVGGWNCDKNQNSRDAIVILDTNREIVGSPWRGNLRKNINVSSTTTDWIAALFGSCGSNVPAKPRMVQIFERTV